MTDARGRRIDVAAEPDAGGWTCAVTVSDAGGSTRHRVRVDRKVLDELAPGASDPVALVRASFAFLLDREPKESILASFELPVIGRYFREYEAAMRRTLGTGR